MSVAFLYTNNKRLKREIKETISLTITSKRIKYLGMNLPKEANFWVVQWLRHHAANAGDPGLIPGQRTRSHMPQLSSGTSLWLKQ